MRVFRTLLIGMFLLCTFYSYGQCEAKIKEFYAQYMRNAENNEEDNVELLKAYTSTELIEKLRGYTQKYDVDAVLHAQDVCQYGIKSLKVRPLKNDWYLVKYKWSPETEPIKIPLRAVDTDGKLLILDISPIESEQDFSSEMMQGIKSDFQLQ